MPIRPEGIEQRFAQALICIAATKADEPAKGFRMRRFAQATLNALSGEFDFPCSHPPQAHRQ